MKKLRWGVLGVARIATKKVIPGMQRGEFTTVDAIASRDIAKARAAAAELGLAKAYGSYDALVADPDIDAIYNPLPNHLHVEWTTRAAEAGKHVLCEKPIGLVAADAERLLAVRDRTGVLIQEAFMRRRVISATDSNWPIEMRRNSAVASAAIRIAVPVADAQFSVNTAASARSLRYAESLMRLRSTANGTTG